MDKHLKKKRLPTAKENTRKGNNTVRPFTNIYLARTST